MIFSHRDLYLIPNRYQDYDLENELFYEAEQVKKKHFIFINLMAVWYQPFKTAKGCNSTTISTKSFWFSITS